MKNKNVRKKKSQIWVETVIYTLIGLTIMGVLLAIAMPQLEIMKDRTVIKQTFDALDILDKKISEVEQSTGTIGKVNFKIAKGKLLINGSGNYIMYSLEDSRLAYSQVGKEIKTGEINITTKKNGNRYNIYLKKDYSSIIDISVMESSGPNTDANKLLQAGSTAYSIYLENSVVSPGAVDDKTTIVFRID